MTAANDHPGIRLAPGVVVSPGVLEFTFASSSGPGGQNVNKRATKATLRVRLLDLPLHHDALARLRSHASLYLTTHDELVIPADEERSQERNKALAIERLGDLVKHALVRPKIRKKTRPSRGSKERRLEGKRIRGEIKRGRRDSGE